MLLFIEKYCKFINMEKFDHPDILYLQMRLNQLVSLEEYEIAATIKKWLDELIQYHTTNKQILTK